MSIPLNENKLGEDNGWLQWHNFSIYIRINTRGNKYYLDNNINSGGIDSSSSSCDL